MNTEIQRRRELAESLARAICATARQACPAGFDPQNVDPDTPKDRSYVNELLKTIQGQKTAAGLDFETEAKYQPLNTGLQLQNIDEFLYGSKGGEYEVTERVKNPAYKGTYKTDKNGNLIGSIASAVNPVSVIGGALGGIFGGGGKKKKAPPPAFIEQTRKATYGPQRGFLEIQRGANTYQREGDISDIANLGPKAREALRLANPDNAVLLDLLNASAKGDLELGNHQNASQLREGQQHIRAAQAARGMGFGPADIYQEGMYVGDRGEALADKRKAFAFGMVGLNQGVYGDPFQQVIGRPSGATNNAQAAGAPNQFNPESGYAQDLYNTNYNAAVAAAIASANNKNALIGAGISSVGGAAGSLAGFCWVAREVYGAENPKWLQFRHWLLTEAPAALREAYGRHGENAARWLRDKPEWKAKVRQWMDTKLKGAPHGL